ncbi:hypothetical protein [Herbaspirillum sp. alder98]|uniref:hypothetical protein n=1 Tax=Herbaspirillum sp. alder98 TaxID=2913096 RepID=UPI001CD81FA3|nr:hypothetical protein [Herbaspirillum sp. alder98]MCA1326300.1 hypothetical protein [Herbaspirillum sp. alder98]
MAAPKKLPSVAVLTSALLDHLLDERAANEIREVFDQCSPILKKNLPGWSTFSTRHSVEPAMAMSHAQEIPGRFSVSLQKEHPMHFTTPSPTI